MFNFTFLNFRYGIKIPVEGIEKVPSSRIGRCIACCRAVYWAVLCVVLILVGCPMAAIGTQVRMCLFSTLTSKPFSRNKRNFKRFKKNHFSFSEFYSF